MPGFSNIVQQVWQTLIGALSRFATSLLRLSPLPDFYDVVIVIVIVVVVIYKFFQFATGK